MTEYTLTELKRLAAHYSKGRTCAVIGCGAPVKVIGTTLILHPQSASLAAHHECRQGHNGQAIHIAI